MDEQKTSEEIIVDDEGNKVSLTGPRTARGLKRHEEDRSFVPVIIKRNDQAVRHPDDTLEIAIEEGYEQHIRTKFSLFLSAIAAGLILGFAGMCIALTYQLVPPAEGELISRFASALVYPLGFIICVMGGTQLFTEQTATALYPVLEGKATFRSLVSLWAVVLAGNLVGTLSSSGLLFMAEPVIKASSGYIMVAEYLLRYSFWEVFMSAILAGWLMAKGGWLILATPPAASQIICIYVVTFIIGFGGLHHSIAGSAEIFSGLFHSNDPEYYKSFLFLLASVGGNLFGGSLFVAVLNYGHIRKTQ